jgi:hypothetical protein
MSKKTDAAMIKMRTSITFSQQPPFNQQDDIRDEKCTFTPPRTSAALITSRRRAMP